MEDERYADQYGAPYSDRKVKKWSRMGQQMVDARFLKETSGFYASAGAAARHRVAAGGEIGLFHMPSSWSTVRLGAVGLVAEGLPNYLTGAVVGGRIHAPMRFSPYVGLSGMVGYSETTTRAQNNYFDGDGKAVFAGDEIPGPSAAMAAIIPEVGVSWWLTSRTRCNLNSSYYFTTDGRSQDFLLLGLSFDWAPTPSVDKRADRIHDTPPELENVLDSEPYFRAEEERAQIESSLHVYDGADWPLEAPASDEIHSRKSPSSE